MIISEKQIMQLMDICRVLALDSNLIVLSRKAMELLEKIRNQQSEDLLSIE